MKKVFAFGLFLFFCAKSQAQIIVNSDGSHSIQHGMHAVNSDGTVSAIHGPHLIHQNGTVSVIHSPNIINSDGTSPLQYDNSLFNDNVAVANEFFIKEESKDYKSASIFLKKQQVLYRGRMINLSFQLDKIDDQRKSKRKKKSLKN